MSATNIRAWSLAYSFICTLNLLLSPFGIRFFFSSITDHIETNYNSKTKCISQKDYIGQQQYCQFVGTTLIFTDYFVRPCIHPFVRFDSCLAEQLSLLLVLVSEVLVHRLELELRRHRRRHRARDNTRLRR